MNTELPLYGQEKPNTCALACLRMVLAAFGTEVAEATIEAQAQMQERGTLINELERLAQRFIAGKAANKEALSPVGTAETTPLLSAVPTGLGTPGRHFPSDESLGYCQMSPRDKSRANRAIACAIGDTISERG